MCVRACAFRFPGASEDNDRAIFLTSCGRHCTKHRHKDKEHLFRPLTQTVKQTYGKIQIFAHLHQNTHRHDKSDTSGLEGKIFISGGCLLRLKVEADKLSTAVGELFYVLKYKWIVFSPLLDVIKNVT